VCATLRFLGAAQNVTGSAYLLELGDVRILVDCGLYQERQFRERNWNPFPVAPETIRTVVLTHAHLDHCGLLPKLVREGFGGKVYCTTATAEIARIVVLDAAHLQEEDAAFKRKRHEREGRTGPRPVVPLYTTQDAQACMSHFSPVRYEQPVLLADGLEAVWHDAGHVLGSASIEIRFRRNGTERTIVFSGDVGRWDKPILRDPVPPRAADYVVVESTYGDRLHENADGIQQKLRDIVNATWKAGGNLVIPSFALERAQEVLYHLNLLLLQGQIPHLMVFVDSPMAIHVTEVFGRHPELFDEEMIELLRRHASPFEFPGLTMTESTEQSKAINQIRGTVAIIAGSGMCTGGRIKHHLVNNISRRQSTILFVGYQAVGTLGRHIVDGENPVRILGQMVPVKARIARIQGFSGHADRSELVRWLSGLRTPPRRVFVTHGEPAAAREMAACVQETFDWPTCVPAYRDEAVLD